MDIEKEDGIGNLTMVQLKSTDAQQITIKQKDIRILEQHASESHKAPVFAIQFLNTGEVWLMAKQEDLQDVAEEMGPRKAMYVPNGITEEQEREFVEGIKKDARWEFSRCLPEPVSADPGPVKDEGGIFTEEEAKGAGNASQKLIGSSIEGREEFYKDAGWKK